MSGQAAYEAQYPYCNWLNGDLNDDETVDFEDQEYFLDHLDECGVQRVYTWDAENRLIEYGPEPEHEVLGDQKVELAYDYLGRRVEKTSWIWNGSSWGATPTSDRKFVWSGWLMLMELDGKNDDAIVRKYAWGLDLAGQNGGAGAVASGVSAGRPGDAGYGAPALQGAGGIGGLLAVEQPQGSLKYLYLYDANGNVGQVINPAAADATASIKVKYEYDPYGARTNTAVYGEFNQPFRFSTKYFDSDTALYYFGYRYYHPGLGRWINRDRIRDRLSPNLYVSFRDNPSKYSDPDGRSWIPVLQLAQRRPEQ
jgi:RHS repeat-associated protein